jgi:hypothetical protein|tara:strand:+ start:17 stop:415 length:399 start_codon:yes stop_codon:yes gene_type:complete
MNDELLNIKLTESEINLITLLLEQAGTMQDENGQPAFELLHDIMEQTARHDDPDWIIDNEPTEIGEGFSFSVTENDFIQAGIDAREQVKESSRASIRRAKRFGEFDVSKPDRKLSKAQTHDLWERPNDPTKW